MSSLLLLGDLGHRPGNAFYAGLMDEPTVYNRALTADEIAGIVSADFTGKDFKHPVFTSPSQLPDAITGSGYSQQLKSVLGTKPITFSVSAGALPPGMTLSAIGLVSRAPNAGGNFSFTMRANDAVGLSTDQVFKIKVS